MPSTEPTIAESLLKFAAADIRFARKHGSLTVCQTKQGNIELARCEGRGMVAVNGVPTPVKAATKLLAAAYVIKEEHPVLVSHFPA
jgi:hypothetical protein